MIGDSAEQSAVKRSALGVSDQAMTGSWRVIIARTAERYKALYYNQNDDPRHVGALRKLAEDWLAAQGGDA